MLARHRNVLCHLGNIFPFRRSIFGKTAGYNFCSAIDRMLLIKNGYMIKKIENLPSNMVGFRAMEAVTKDDYEMVVYPAVTELIKRTGQLNYMMVIDTPLHNFTVGAWWQDALLGLKKLTKWHRVAILTDSEGVNKFTGIASLVLPGEYKGFRTTQQEEAVAWVSGKVDK